MSQMICLTPHLLCPTPQRVCPTHSLLCPTPHLLCLTPPSVCPTLAGVGCRVYGRGADRAGRTRGRARYRRLFARTACPSIPRASRLPPPARGGKRSVKRGVCRCPGKGLGLHGTGPRDDASGGKPTRLSIISALLKVFSSTCVGYPCWII
jgi:hypothetical protein